MKYTLVILLSISSFCGCSQNRFNFTITSESASNLSGDELFKYQKYIFRLKVADLDTNRYNSLFWVDNGKALFYKSKKGFAHCLIITDSAYAHVEIYDKTSGEMVQQDSVSFYFPYPPAFDKRWEQMPLDEALAEMKKTKKLNQVIPSNFVSAYWLGRVFPANEFTDLSGNKVQLSKGKNAIVDFTSLGCGPCLKEEKSLDSMSYLSFFAETDLVMVYDFLTEKAKKSFPLRRTHFKLVNDPGYYAENILLKAVPCKFFLDRNGMIRHIEMGALVYFPDGREMKKEEINPYIFKAYRETLELINARYPFQG